MSSSPLWEYAQMLARQEADKIAAAKIEREEREAEAAADRERCEQERSDEEFYSGRRESDETYYGVGGLFGKD